MNQTGQSYDTFIVGSPTIPESPFGTPPTPLDTQLNISLNTSLNTSFNTPPNTPFDTPARVLSYSSDQYGNYGNMSSGDSTDVKMPVSTCFGSDNFHTNTSTHMFGISGISGNSDNKNTANTTDNKTEMKPLRRYQPRVSYGNDEVVHYVINNRGIMVFAPLQDSMVRKFTRKMDTLAKTSDCLKLKTASLIIGEKAVRYDLNNTKIYTVLSKGVNKPIRTIDSCNNYWLDYWGKKIFRPSHRIVYHGSEATVEDYEDLTKPTGSFELWCETDEFKILHKAWSQSCEIHAEMDSLTDIPKSKYHNLIMFSVYSPCNNCAKHIITYNIRIFYYRHVYKHGENALILLKRAGIQCIQLP